VPIQGYRDTECRHKRAGGVVVGHLEAPELAVWGLAGFWQTVSKAAVRQTDLGTASTPHEVGSRDRADRPPTGRITYVVGGGPILSTAAFSLTIVASDDLASAQGTDCPSAKINRSS
jgi:hypothetical protein